MIDEMKREREFYRMRGLPCPKDIPPNSGSIEEEKTQQEQVAELDFHRMDEQVSILYVKFKYCLYARTRLIYCQIFQ